ncbi:MAG: mannitol dehydrogenase family protein [Planctomycetota bacterium]|jgi:mannitol-1-phosphate/altronate dehydrogenase
MTEHILTGFGFGPIQAGLFAKEAFQSGNFARIVVSEIDAELVEAVRANKGSYRVNVAKSDGIEVLKVDNVELLDPNVEADRKALLEVLPQSTEIATCLPSVSFYEAGRANSVASLIAEGLEHNNATGTIIYASENNNHAAEMLEKAVGQGIGGQIPRNVRFLNTVIGKMSRAVTEPAEIAELGLETIAPGLERAFLVEQFNRILVSRAQIPDFKPGIEVFIEKDDLLPFEEAKLYGHNAVHSLLGFIGAVKGCTSMTELKDDEAVMQIGRAAFLQESGAALVRKYAHLDDELFTETGFADYAEDLLERMTNPYLGDTVARVVRDAARKLSIDGRIFGTMQLALEHDIEPKNMALGAMAGIAVLLKKAEENGLPNDMRFGNWRELSESEIERIIDWLWAEQEIGYAEQIIRCIRRAGSELESLMGE